MDLVAATSQLNVIRLMVMMTMMVQSARATSLKDPLAIDAPWELYFLIVLISVAVVAGWECMWGLWYYLTGQETPD